MAIKLVIVESPGKVKTIGRFLGAEYKVEASLGHVMDLPKSQLGVDIENGFEPKYILMREKTELINKLKKEAKASSEVLLATDPDREGEAISSHLARLLDIDPNRSCRITFNEITQNAVLKAVASPRVIDAGLVDAQQARRVLDRIVGYKLSPVLWKKVRKGLSAGRVQSVTVRMICDREDEIKAFITVEFWNLLAQLTKKKSRQTFSAKYHGKGSRKVDLKNQQQTDEIISQLNDAKYLVTKIKKAEKRKNPAPPFITSTLQQEASRKLGFTAKRTMMTAQQLYEGVNIKGEGSVGLISYMRTDSLRISAEALTEARTHITTKFGGNYLPRDVRFYKNKSSSQDAHEAIRPTHVENEPVVLRDSLTPDQFKLYKLIYDRFLACQMASAIYDTLSVDIDASGHTFKANGSKMKFPGFTLVYNEGRDKEKPRGSGTDSDEGNEEENDNSSHNDNDNEEMNIPELEEGEELLLKKLKPSQHFTQPPPRYTEATLVKALEENGIGRPSTYSPTISTIIDREYVVREAKTLVPTDLGKIVTELLKEHFKEIVDVKFTAHMEGELDKVEEGVKKGAEVLTSFYDGFNKVLETADTDISKVLVPEIESDVICDKCGRKMVMKSGKFGKFLACPGFPVCKNTKPMIEDTGITCPKCGDKVVFRKSKKGRKFYTCENSADCGYISWHKPGITKVKAAKKLETDGSKTSKSTKSNKQTEITKAVKATKTPKG